MSSQGKGVLLEYISPEEALFSNLPKSTKEWWPYSLGFQGWEQKCFKKANLQVMVHTSSLDLPLGGTFSY